MDEMVMIETLESAWFFSNVFSAKPTNHNNPKINFEQEPEPGSDSSEATKPTNQTPENQPKPSEIRSPPPNSPQEKPLTRRLIEVPATEPVVSEVSRSPRRREEDERRRMRRRQRNYSNRGICRGLNLEGEIEFCGGLGELKSNAVLKDERTMKRHLKTWAVVVASSSVAHNRPMLALCC